MYPDWVENPFLHSEQKKSFFELLDFEFKPIVGDVDGEDNDWTFFDKGGGNIGDCRGGFRYPV
jgi:hypothetical protein